MNVKKAPLVWILLLIANENVCQAEYCHSKFGSFKEDQFNLHACSLCYHFLFRGHAYRPYMPRNCLVPADSLTTSPSELNLICPDLDNTTAMRTVCSTLTDDECERWRLCCKASRECCREQLQSRDHDVNNTCPPTWDGYACWNSASPGTTNYLSCPKYLPYSVPTRSAFKTCQTNGTWQKKGPPYLEWTDYTPCLNYEDLKVSIYISLGCQIASLLCLIPSVVIFITYKSLISQHRIRLHVNFFISFIASGIFTILWDTTITYDRLTNENVSDTHLYKNSGFHYMGFVPYKVLFTWDGLRVQCKLLSFVKIYFTSTNYVWMFCEGLYLYRLIGNAFNPPKKLVWFYMFGWGFPLIYSLAYGAVRLTVADEHCWGKSIGNIEWILYAPNLLCLMSNIFFLCRILRILLTQLQSHPNEPSNFRKALKATFVLIPLFGVQLVVTVYRVPTESPGALHYERFSMFMTNSQGLFTAIIFCLCNFEVLTLMRHSVRRRRNTLDLGSKKANSAITMNAFNTTFTSRLQSSLHKKNNSPHRGLERISCLKKSNSDATPV